MTTRRAIAVIDDDPMTLRAMRALLGWDYDVTTTIDPRVLVNLIIAGRTFDAILSDVYMPTDGEELHAMVHAVSPTQAARMIFLTGGGLPKRLEDFLSNRLVVQKPADANVLRRMIWFVSALHGPRG